MNTFTPKEVFLQSHDLEAKFLTEFAMSPTARIVVVFAMSQMVHDNASKEQLEGAKRFAHILLNLGDKDEPIPAFPDKSIAN